MHKTPDLLSNEKISRRTFLKIIAAVMTGTLSAFLSPAGRRRPEPSPPSVPQEVTTYLPEVATPPPEYLFFDSSIEANQYLMDQEAEAGFDRNTMTEDELKAHRIEQRSHQKRTIRFAISTSKYNEYKNQGKDIQQLLKKQIDTVNLIYEKANLPVRYTLQPTLIINWEVPSADISHIGNANVQIGYEEKLDYSWADDTLWVVADDTSFDAANRHSIMYIFNPDENGVDAGFIHEIIHHLGIHDLYRSRGNFKEGPLSQVRPYDMDVMCIQESLQLTPATTLGASKFLEQPYYGPQHDSPILIAETGKRLLDSYSPHGYQVSFKDRSNNQLRPYVKSVFFASAKDEKGCFVEDRHNVVAENDSFNLNDSRLTDCKYSLFDIGQIRIPIERLHLIYSYLYTQQKDQSVPIDITLLVDPNTFVQNKKVTIEMVSVGEESQVQEEYYGKKVVAYSPISGTGVFTVWLDGKLSQEPDSQNDDDLG